MSLDRIWAGWRQPYVEGVAKTYPDVSDCLMCALATGADEETRLLDRNELVFAVLNAYPYTNGHLMVAPVRHVAEYEELSADEILAIGKMVQRAVRALKAAYHPDGLNTGMNLGRSAGAGVPGHLHEHVLPRWSADSNFMTTVAETRVLPESFDTTYKKLKDNWPDD